MADFRCKTCGGSIYYDGAERRIVCDSCGASQILTDALTGNCIYDNNEASSAALSTYCRAINMMSSANTEKSLTVVAELFEKIPGIFNSNLLAKECREKAELCKIERLYQQAVLDMQSDDPAKIKNAAEIFESISGYKDAASKSGECKPLLAKAEDLFEQKVKEAEVQRQKEEEKRKKAIASKKRRKWLILSAAVIVIAAIIIGNSIVYSKSNIKISITPNAENYLSESGNRYVFRYDVKIKNNGFHDVSAIEGNVIFEKGNEILVDTEISFNNYSSVVVRAKKSSKYTWELTVYSYDTALTLYETDFDDLKITVDITGITYKNGKTKTY